VIVAAEINAVPSSPSKVTEPIESPLETIPCVPTVPLLDFASTKAEGLTPVCHLAAPILDVELVNPLTCRLDLVEPENVYPVVDPTATLPSAATTNGVASGLALSSTNSALPVPSCVIRKAAFVLSVTLITVLPPKKFSAVPLA
jgi:hypothetical protein